MKTPFRFHLLAPVLLAVAVGTAAFAQPPPRNPSDSGAGAGPVPNPGRPGSGYPLPLGRIAIPGPDAPPPVQRRYSRTVVVSADGDIAQVQRGLKRHGYYAGPIDGDAGPGTRAAIRSFRRGHSLGSSTAIDGELIRALRQ